MESINISISRNDVYQEVMKATDYTGAKLIFNDENAREKFYATQTDLSTLSRFWDEAAETFNERLKSMVVSCSSENNRYEAVIEVSKSFDKNLAPSVEKTSRSFFIAFIIGEWFKISKKDEAADYFNDADEQLTNVERLLYSRKKPTIPT